MAKDIRPQGRLQRKHIMSRYGITRQQLDKEIQAGRINFNNTGWCNLAEVERWAKEKGYERIDLVEVDMSKISGGGIVGEDILRSLVEFDIPEVLIKKAEDAQSVAKALIGTAQAQDKQIRALREAGRLGDTNELQVVVGAVIAGLVAGVKGLADDIGATTAKSHKLKLKESQAVLKDATAHLLKILEASAGDLESRVVAFQDSKAAETRQRKRVK